jgi:hypothetical protein
MDAEAHSEAEGTDPAAASQRRGRRKQVAYYLLYHRRLSARSARPAADANPVPEEMSCSDQMVEG